VILRALPVEMRVDPSCEGSLALIETARRLCDLIDEETLLLRRFATVDVREFNRRKQQGLLDLDRALRALRGHPLPQDASESLADLRKRLEGNLAVLSLHLDAMTEVAELIKTSIRNAESDGTYGPRGTLGSALR
jgi:hypothetical protein